MPFKITIPAFETLSPTPSADASGSALTMVESRKAPRNRVAATQGAARGRDARPLTLCDLRSREHSFLVWLQRIGFGYVEGLRVRNGQLDLQPLPRFMRTVKLGETGPLAKKDFAEDTQSRLTTEAAAFFAFVRASGDCVIQKLHIRFGVPHIVEVLANAEVEKWLQ